MTVRIKYDIVPDYVKPKLGDLSTSTITLKEYKLQPSAQIASTIDPPIIKGDSSGDSWYSWTIALNLGDINPIVSGAENFFKTLDKVSATITQLLKAIRLLSSSSVTASVFLKFAIKQLAMEIKLFIDSLTSTGLYTSLIIPDFDKTSPKYNIPTFGGYQEFITRVNATCLSSRDPDSPRFDDADKVGGVVIAMLGGVDDPDFLRNLLDNFKKLSGLFGFKIPYPQPALKLKAVPGFYDKKGVRTLGVKLSWEVSDSPVKSFYVYRSSTGKGTPVRYTINGSDIDVNVFAKGDPIVKINSNMIRPSYSYIDYDVKPETTSFYKVYSVAGDDYLEEHPYLRAVDSPISTPMAVANVSKECIPVSELKKYMSLSMSGELLSPFDLEGDWQSFTVRNMMGSQIDGMYSSLDVLADQLVGLVATGSGAINDYLKFYGERVEDLLEIINKIKGITVRLSSFTQRGTFMVLNLPLENGGMRGFVDRFNKACNSGSSSKSTPKDKKVLGGSVSIEKNSPIATFNEKGIMFGVILLYGIPDLSNPDRLSDLAPEYKIATVKKQYENSDKAISTLLKMLGLGK